MQSNTQTTVGRTLLNEWSARRRGPLPTQHTRNKRKETVPSTGFEPAVPAIKRFQHPRLRLPGQRDRRFVWLLALYISALNWGLRMGSLYYNFVRGPHLRMHATFLSQPIILELMAQVMLGVVYEMQSSSLCNCLPSYT